MVSSGSEWSLGVINDPDFGPAVRVAPGGLLVDLLNESALLMAPFSSDEARAAINALQASKLLAGYRGGTVLNVQSLAQTAACLSRLAWDMRDTLAEIEINPVIVGTQTTIAVDAVIRARQSS
jgi:hypothetical protein